MERKACLFSGLVRCLLPLEQEVALSYVMTMLGVDYLARRQTQIRGKDRPPWPASVYELEIAANLGIYNIPSWKYKN
jgi:hypothetical protein